MNRNIRNIKIYLFMPNMLMIKSICFFKNLISHLNAPAKYARVRFETFAWHKVFFNQPVYFISRIFLCCIFFTHYYSSYSWALKIKPQTNNNRSCGLVKKMTDYLLMRELDKILDSKIESSPRLNFSIGTVSTLVPLNGEKAPNFSIGPVSTLIPLNGEEALETAKVLAELQKCKDQNLALSPFEELYFNSLYHFFMSRSAGIQNCSSFPLNSTLNLMSKERDSSTRKTIYTLAIWAKVAMIQECLQNDLSLSNEEMSFKNAYGLSKQIEL